jgi:hypothetical protein
MRTATQSPWMKIERRWLKKAKIELGRTRTPKTAPAHVSPFVNCQTRTIAAAVDRIVASTATTTFRLLG